MLISSLTRCCSLQYTRKGTETQEAQKSHEAPPLFSCNKAVIKATTITSMITMLLAGAVLAQDRAEIRADMLAALSGDTKRFERGMEGLEALLIKEPQNPELKVLHGNGVFARSGAAFEKGDIQNALKLWQSALQEMAQAAELAPDNIFVRARLP
jgi:hypothetical protein